MDRDGRSAKQGERGRGQVRVDGLNVSNTSLVTESDTIEALQGGIFGLLYFIYCFVLGA